MANPQASTTDLISDLSQMTVRYPAFASYFRMVRDAVIGSTSEGAVHAVILAALENGCNTYSDLRESTGYSPSFLHRHLGKMISAGRIYSTDERLGGHHRPRKLFFIAENKALPHKK